MKKLYRATVEVVVLFVADEDEDDMDYLATKAAEYELGEDNGDVCGTDEVHDVDGIPPKWRGCLPHGANDDRPVEAWLATPVAAGPAPLLETPSGNGGDTNG